MRVLFVLLAASVALFGCKNNDSHDNNANIEENLTAENIVSNDVTAIDAVTGDAANMAEDVDVNYSNPELNVGGTASSSSARAGRTPPKATAADDTNVVSATAGNAATNAE